MTRKFVAHRGDIPADSFDLDITIILSAEVRAELDGRMHNQAAGLLF